MDIRITRDCKAVNLGKRCTEKLLEDELVTKESETVEDGITWYEVRRYRAKHTVFVKACFCADLPSRFRCFKMWGLPIFLNEVTA